ncbi:MAG: hypothetical protein HYY44_00455 [Deltaproteobacteria bacterium]|nr:hypothetical protein [Deltaproteobacteria bacterium]
MVPSSYHVEQIVENLYGSLKEGGPLHAALVAAEMDGTEQMLGLVQTSLEIIIPSLVTGGAAGLARLGAFGVRAKKAVDAARLARATVATERAGAGTRALRGFGLGVYSATAENFLATGTGEVRQRADTIESLLKDAIATGSSMAVTALVRIPQSDHPNLLMRLYERYTTQGARHIAGTFTGDVGMEIVEEVIDQYVRQYLDGNFDAMTWNELREITTVCLVTRHCSK